MRFLKTNLISNRLHKKPNKIGKTNIVVGGANDKPSFINKILSYNKSGFGSKWLIISILFIVMISFTSLIYAYNIHHEANKIKPNKTKILVSNKTSNNSSSNQSNKTTITPPKPKTSSSTSSSSSSNPIKSTSSQVNSQSSSSSSSQVSTGLTPPSGYTASQLIFDDQFSGTTLDSTKWNTYMGASGQTWNNSGNFASPYSGPNTSNNGVNSFNAFMYGPSQVSTNNGLTLKAEPNPLSQYNSGWQWLSGVVTTEGKFTLPTSGWYVQASIKVPDETQGMWPGMWFLPGTSSSPFNEIDGLQGGFTDGAISPNQINSPGYFSDSDQDYDSLDNLGIDMSAGYHVYGVKWLPGNSVTWYIDGKQEFQVTQAQVGNIDTEGYEIILNLQVAGSKASGFHSVYSGSTPTSSMEVSEVQAYN